MQVTRNLPLIMVLIFLGSCIDPFEPEIDENREVLVIEGVLKDTPGPQEIKVSRSVPYGAPDWEPVSGCVVHVEDDRGGMLVYRETEPGRYEALPDPGFVAAGRSYSLVVDTPSERQVRSDHQPLLSCPPVDSLYYEVERKETADRSVVLHGLQFFLDVEALESTEAHYRWILTETWEYTAALIPELVWFGGPVIMYLSDSTYRCYRKTPVQSLFSASTRNLSTRRLVRSPLNFVSNETPRIRIKYRLHVEQHSLTESGYEYFRQLSAQQSEGGSLYETQPATVRGNLSYTDGSGDKVLGFFYATQVASGQLTVEGPHDFPVFGYQCALDTVESLSLLDDNYPHYLFSLAPDGISPPYQHGGKECFDCRLLGGSTSPPENW